MNSGVFLELVCGIFAACGIVFVSWVTYEFFFSKTKFSNAAAELKITLSPGCKNAERIIRAASEMRDVYMPQMALMIVDRSLDEETGDIARRLCLQFGAQYIARV